jgi:hypothetical protein
VSLTPDYPLAVVAGWLHRRYPFDSDKILKEMAFQQEADPALAKE